MAFHAKRGKHLREPIGQGHHDVEGSEEKNEMKERVGVGDCVFFVIDHGLSFSFIGHCKQQTKLINGGQDQN